MAEVRRPAAAAWIAAGVAAVIMIGAIAFYVFGRTDDTAAEGSPFTGDEQAAVSAAGVDVANLLTFSRKNYEADFKRALASATGDLAVDIQGKKAVTLKTITDGKFDLSAKVTHTALIGPAENQKGYTVLVSINGYRSTQLNLPTQQNLQVTVVKKGKNWVLNDVKAIGVS